MVAIHALNRQKFFDATGAHDLSLTVPSATGADGGVMATGSPIMVEPCVDAGQLQAVTEIYAYHVLHGTGTFEIDPPGVAEMTRRRDDVVGRGLAFVVGRVDGKVVGFAYAAPFRLRPAYRFTVEDSVYVHPAWARRGVGRALLASVMTAAQAGGVVQMLALVGDSGNIASLRLHQALGFRHVGVLAETGFKFGRWLDVVVLQANLGSGPSGETPVGGWKTLP